MDRIIALAGDNLVLFMGSSLAFCFLLFLLIALWPSKKASPIEVKIVFERGSVCVMSNGQEVEKMIEQVKAAIYAGL